MGLRTYKGCRNDAISIHREQKILQRGEGGWGEVTEKLIVRHFFTDKTRGATHSLKKMGHCPCISTDGVKA